MNEQSLRNAHELHQSGRHAEAERLYAEILRDDPGNTSALLMLGYIYLRRGALPEALAQFDRVLAIRPDEFDALAARGAVLSGLDRHQEALNTYDRAVALRQNSPQLYNNRGNALLTLNRGEEAVASYAAAIRIDPAYAEAWCNRGIALLRLSRPAEALDSFKQAIKHRPDNADAWEGSASALTQLERRAEAVTAYDKLIALRRPTPDLLYNRANTNAILKNHEAAIHDCETLLATAPDYPYARGVLAHAKMQICDWSGLNELTQQIAEALRAGRRVISPFNLKALSNSPELQLRCAELWVAHELSTPAKPLTLGRVHDHPRIRIAYVSGDFCNSAVAGLMATVFEHHDPRRFETIAVSFGSTDHSAMRRRLEAGFERFADVTGKTDFEIASWMCEAEIDIAVDLMGFTGQCRSAIFAHRPAPLQVNYIGFPGSLGAPWYDYIVADRTVIPDTQAAFFSEKLALLPQCYLPADGARLHGGRHFSREAAGLPPAETVFASFNNSYKFSPDLFACWMRILRAVEGSVLWLPQNHPGARSNLLREAAAQGIARERLIFAAPLPAIEAHLARLSLADLFLDTMPYNSHSTAIDALTAGVPIVTVLGNSFASRVAASALRAAGLPQLVTNSLAQYETLVLDLARDPAAIPQLKSMLSSALEGSSLFDVVGFTRGLEDAFESMWQRSRIGDPPASFVVPA